MQQWNQRASTVSAGDPANGSDRNMGWKLPDKNYYSIELERKITVLNWKEKCIFFSRNVYVREILYISPSSEKKIKKKV